MQYPKYETLLTKPDFTGFTFISIGPNGNFEIEVQFTPIIESEEVIFYNLGFGAIDKSGELDDTIILNNGDRNKIIATIAGLTMIFLKQYPTASVFFSGSTPARTRLYRRSIAINIEELKHDFEIIGIPKDERKKPELFVPDEDYVAFLVRKYL